MTQLVLTFSHGYSVETEGKQGHQQGEQPGYCDDPDRLCDVDRSDKYCNSKYILNVVLTGFADG